MSKLRKLFQILAILFGVAAVGLLGGIVVLQVMFGPGDPVTDVREYERILAENSHFNYFNEELIKHLPAQIPPNAKNIHFYFCPPFVIAGPDLQLRYETTPEKIAELYEHFSKVKKHSFTRSAYEELRSKGLLTEWVDLPPFRAGGSDVREFPDDYEILFISTGNESCGVAISRQRNEIIYWVETHEV